MSLRCAHLIAMAVLDAMVGAACAAGPDGAAPPNDNPAKKVGMKLQSLIPYPDDASAATLDVADPRDFGRARDGGTVNYNILRLAAGLGRILPRDWQARIMLNGRYGNDALISGQQFGVGGATPLRGYGGREIADDIGLAANLELYTPNLCAAHAGWNCRALTFYDSAYLKRNRELAGELSGTAVGSVGIGLRMLVTRAINLQLDYGHVVRAGATDSVDANRVHLRISLSY